MRENRRSNSKAGFTLVEILLVMVIIGVLAGVVVVSFGGRSTEARINATRSSISAVCLAIDAYEIEVGKYPSSLQDLTVSIDGRPPYIKGGVPVDSWGNTMTLDNAGTGNYLVKSAGPDGQMGSEDDITSHQN
ncbi:hypothetical protein BVX97_01935 [bacterium E08(2017)]|nr:hypothetical protein BVX97_01935 [bacterium E08(2017)]